MLDGVVEGADAVRSVVLTIRSLYEDQEFKFAGAYGDDGFLEDYVAKVNGEPIVLCPLAGREVRRHSHCRTLRRQRVLGTEVRRLR